MPANTLELALALRGAPLFASLSADILLPIAQLCTEQSLEAGDVLFCKGDPGDALYVILHGTVAVERDDTIVATLGPGDCVGELAALDWETRSATVFAHTSTQLIRLDRNDLLDLLGDNPDLVRDLAVVLVGRLRRTMEP